MDILISGASVGGPALAYWLERYGHNVTVVEVTPGFRPGGQAIDVRGPALEVASRMGVLDEIRRHKVQMRGMSVVDDDGKEVYRSEEHTLTGGDLASADIEILRDDLSQIFVRAVGDRVEYLLGDTVTAIDQDDSGARVTFATAAPRTFDLVVGADGLHSNTRRLVFGPESQFIEYMGTYLAVWTIPNYLELDRWQVFHQIPGDSWGGGVMSVRGNSEARVYMGFESEEPIAYDYRDIPSQKRILRERLGGFGWELPRMLDHMEDAEDFHFDPMAQIRMDTWSQGRVVLLGDAGYCGSPLSGQGTSMAMVGAYVLAGEIKEAGGDHRTALAAYEREMRDYVKGNQDLAFTNRERFEAQQSGVEFAGPAVGDVVNAITLKDY
ncbi:FAD-dependent monooxygenase [Nonomuraea rhizosphaerae]|uniref:FAD-dependent monooxygenase n=1 Tax=Nonomuraea rhizosphaerae TaxID=2665663 RepID=UPI001C5EACC6|nr:FAD-dependent monooxygenase [Nonomuraea rhizosphaerae]